MSKYPTEITPEILLNSQHITLAEMRQDIAEAKADIARVEQEIKGHEIIAAANVGQLAGKMPNFLAEAKKDTLVKMREQLAFIELLLAAREAAEDST